MALTTRARLCYRETVGRDRMAILTERLGRSAVFAALDTDRRAEIARAGARRALRRRQCLFRRGETADHLALILTGRLDVVRVTDQGEPVILRSLGPDAIVGLSIVAGATHSADVIAGESGAVFSIPGGVLRAVFARHPEAALRAVVHLARLLSELSDEVEELRVHNLEERITRRLRRIGRGKRELHLTHAKLAAHVGATRANVSRALERIDARGLIRRHRGRLELLGLEGR
jgi:CRP-like cAMP-binding protein